MTTQLFQLDIVNGVKAANTSHAITAAEALAYVGFATDTDVHVSFNGGTENFPLKAGMPMALPANVTSIGFDVAAKLYLGV